MRLQGTEVQKYDCTVSPSPVEQVETNLQKLDGGDFVPFLITCQFFYHCHIEAKRELRLAAKAEEKVEEKADNFSEKVVSKITTRYRQSTTHKIASYQ